ncbi:MAG: hypothetical protein D3908_05965, partial [Candidatus Electrothrix sp. AUS4]|nr:hypothetical protein [Candidatus Electrothrix sp. AUS4]
FVDDFTDNFQNYIPIDPIKRRAFEDEQRDHIIDINRQVQIDDDLKKVDIKIKALVQELNQPEVTSLEDVESFLIGPDRVSGKINQLQRDKAKTIPNDIDITSLDRLLPSVSRARSLLVELNNDIAALHSNSSKINFKELYSALTAISTSPDGNSSLCPACRTPLSRVEVNPFTNARNELINLEDLAKLQARIQSNIRLLSRIVKETNTLLQTIENDAKKACQQELLFTVLTEIEDTNIEATPSWSQKLQQELEYFSGTEHIINSTKTAIQKYNSEKTMQRKRASKNYYSRY